MTARLVLGAAGATVAVGVVWFFGFDVLWAVASVITVGAVGAVIANLSFNDSDPLNGALNGAPFNGSESLNEDMDPPARTPPRGTRLTFTMLVRALEACDRLARPEALQRLRAIVLSERTDIEDRLAVTRQMRALLTSELALRGAESSAWLPPEARAMLEPHPAVPVNTAAIARTLDAIDGFTTTPRISS